MTIEVIRGKGTPTSHLPFSPAIKAGDFVFVSGQASVDETGKIVAENIIRVSQGKTDLKKKRCAKKRGFKKVRVG